MTNACNVPSRTIFTGDNLDILRGINSECVDLIYLDPPFKSDQIYAAPLDSEAKGAEFDDVWTLDDMKEEWLDEIEYRRPALFHLINGAKLSHSESMAGYLTFMAIRLLEMHRVLKPTGSIYLHCDTHASHYLKAIMDALFGENNFRNDIIWRRYGSHNDATRRFGRIHDSLLFYNKSELYKWTNDAREPYDEEYIKKAYRYEDFRGRYTTAPLHGRTLSGGGYSYEWRGITDLWRFPKERLDELDADSQIHWPTRGRIPRRKVYLNTEKGVPARDIILDVASPVPKNESTGWRTQKPLSLLERIIKASSNEGDLVLDPFCGCATSCIAAEKLGRQWIGIDKLPQAADVLRDRARRELQIPMQDDNGKSWADWSPLILTAPRPRTDLKLDFPTDPRSDKELLYASQQRRCAGCEYELPLHVLTIDHITPRSKGGLDAVGNLQLMCHTCNAIKGDRSMEYLRQQLQVRGILAA